MSFQSRDLNVHLIPGSETFGLFACNVCGSTPGAPKPQCPPPSRPQCQASVKPPKATDPEGLDLASLRHQLRETLQRVQ